MLDGVKRLKSAFRGCLARWLGTAMGRRAALADDRDLLHAIWQALNIARDNKALVVARDGVIININQLASQLCGCSGQELIGRRVITELFEGPRYPAAASERWETELTAASGARIPVEVTREPLGTRLQELEVYAIRDLRERRGTAAQIEEFNLRLQRQHDLLK
jgi:PAS domain-containing protein